MQTLSTINRKATPHKWLCWIYRLKISLLFCFAFGIVNAQTVTNPADTDPDYEARKQALIQSQILSSQTVAKPRSITALPDCFELVDESWSTAPRNDDGSIGPIALGWDFSLYGTIFSSVFINTNGNITFNSPLGTFSPTGFPISTPMVAAFWADVDTRPATSGVIRYKVFSDRLVVTWDHVGYFSQQIDKTNTFQMTIKANTGASFSGNDVIFAYDDMQWTTGSASGGVGGFGGSAATVGVNKGNTIDFIQTGRFNINSSDPPNIPTVGTPGGISWLDGQCLGFQVGNTGNVPPAVAGLPANITLESGDVRTISMQFSGPETNQNVNVTFNANGLCGVSAVITNNDTPNPNVVLTITGGACNLGSNMVSFTATDNGTPIRTQTFPLTIIVNGAISPPTLVAVSPAEVCVGSPVSLTASCATGTVLWYNDSSGSVSIGSGSPFATVANTSGTISYFATCKSGTLESIKVASNSILVKALPVVIASNTGPYINGQTIQLNAQNGMSEGRILVAIQDSYTWSGPNAFTSNLQNPTISSATSTNAGIYTVSLQASSGCTGTATTRVIVNSSNANWRTDLVQAGTNFQTLFPLFDGITIAALPALNTGITGTPIGTLDTMNVQSVRFTLSSSNTDPLFNNSIVENIAAFSVYRNLGPQIYGPIFPPGTYTLVTTGYQLDAALGDIVYGPETINFTIVANTFTLALANPSLTSTCAGNSLNVTFTSSGTFNAANIFEVQLSNANGTFEDPIKIGESASAGTISCQIPMNIAGGNGYKIRIYATNPALLSNIQTGSFAINPRQLLLQSPSDDYSILVNKRATQTITATNKVISPANVTYQAGKSIILNAGFAANAGAVFRAEIQICPN